MLFVGKVFLSNFLAFSCRFVRLAEFGKVFAFSLPLRANKQFLGVSFDYEFESYFIILNVVIVKQINAISVHK